MGEPYYPRAEEIECLLELDPEDEELYECCIWRTRAPLTYLKILSKVNADDEIEARMVLQYPNGVQKVCAVWSKLDKAGFDQLIERASILEAEAGRGMHRWIKEVGNMSGAGRKSAKRCPECGAERVLPKFCPFCGKTFVRGSLTLEDMGVKRIILAGGTEVAMDRLLEEIKGKGEIGPKEMKHIIERVARGTGVDRKMVESLFQLYRQGEIKPEEY